MELAFPGMSEPKGVDTSVVHVWSVGALCRAVADTLGARFNPVAVRGEITGFSRAGSGHCYFSVKDTDGQIRCAMFRRAASLLDFSPRDGELVELRGRLGVYEQRGDLQLVVESMQRSGQGTLFEQFLLLKSNLQAQGLFDPARKRCLPKMPRAIGVVTSLGAAALHDVVSTLHRRVPHIPVIVVPTQVQGAQASADIVRALNRLYPLCCDSARIEVNLPRVDVILLVRGGGSIEDLWAYNSEPLAHCIVQSPVPVVCGVGHETDFTIADFCADVRAATPTAAAEIVCQPQEAWLRALDLVRQHLTTATWRHLDRQEQRLDLAGSRLGRPSVGLAHAHARLGQQAQRLQYAMRTRMRQFLQDRGDARNRVLQAFQARLRDEQRQLDRLALRLQSVDPRLMLRRGYAWLNDGAGHAVSSVQQTHVGQTLRATLADGEVDLVVSASRAN